MKKAVVMLSALVVLVSGTLACQFGAALTPTPQSTSTPTPKPTRTPGPTPTPLPLRASGWEEVTVHTLCLEVEQSYPQIMGQFSLPLAEDVRSTLTGLGLQIVTGGAPCEATLTFVLVGKALEGRYVPGGDCYAGADFRGQVILAMPGREPLTLSVFGLVPPPQTITSCPREPREAPLEEAWWKAMLEGLTPVWGVPVIIEAARLDEAPHRLQVGDSTKRISERISRVLTLRRVVRRALEESGPEAIPVLIQALGDRDTSVRYVAAGALADKGPEAVEAVPALIVALEDEDTSIRLAAAGALEAITGQDFGEDADAWQAWWEGQQ